MSVNRVARPGSADGWLPVDTGVNVLLVRSLTILTCFALVAGCAGRPAQTEPGAVNLKEAMLDPSGMASIGKVVPSPWPETPPPRPQSAESLVERYARENNLSLSDASAQINGSVAFQQEMQALAGRLRREEAGNFVDMRIVRDPAVAAEVAFVHNPGTTLARHTRNPRFRAVQVPRTGAEMDTTRELWIGRMNENAIINGISGDPFSGRLEIDVAISESEFRTLAHEKGWSWGDEVQLSFSPAQPTAQVDPAANYPFHLFPRAKNAAGMVLTVAISGTVVLDSGCFRLLDRDGKVGNLVLFDRNAQIGRDAQGYLAVFENGKAASRIGEPAIWGGYPGAVETDPDVVALRQKCGTDPISSVGVPASARLFALPPPEWAEDYAKAKHVSYQEAWTRIIACMKEYEQRHGAAPFLAARDSCIGQFN